MRMPLHRGLPLLWAAVLLIVTPSGLAQDCNTNAIPDESEDLPDCNTNGVPDECETSSGYALELDGIDDYVLLGNPDVLNFEGQVTIEAWIRPDTTSSDFFYIVSHGFQFNPYKEVVLRVYYDTLEVFSYSADGTYHGTYYYFPGAAGVWTHVAGTHDGTRWQLFVNGQPVSESIDAVGAVTVDSDWAIGVREGNLDFPWDGALDEVRIWNMARSQAQIQSGMNKILTGYESGLVGYWRLDEMTGTIAHDWTPNGNDGTLMNGPVWFLRDDALPGTDCNTSGVLDECELDGDTDCDTNGVLDICEISDADCNTNGLPDACDIEGPASLFSSAPGLPLVDFEWVTDTIVVPPGPPVNDVNVHVVITHTFIGEVLYELDHENSIRQLSWGWGGLRDDADILFDDSATIQDYSGPQFGTFKPARALNPLLGDGDSSGEWTIRVLDGSELGGGMLNEWSFRFAQRDDCNTNDAPDTCELADGQLQDCNTNGEPDPCEGPAEDCDGNGMIDACEVAAGTNPDCNTNGLHDACDILAESDCDTNGVLDACEVAAGTNPDCNTNGLHDTCDVLAESDCNTNSALDACEVTAGIGPDCNTNGAPDECDLDRPAIGSFDCNTNGMPDDCELAGDPADCNTNGVPDACDATVAGKGVFDVATYLTGRHSLSFVVAADLDGDGDVDVAAAEGDDTAHVSTFRNDGSGALSNWNSYPVRSYAYALAAADLDGDGDIDLLTTTNSNPGGGFDALFNDGSGAFAVVPNAFGERSGSIAAADFDGDQDIDVAVVENRYPNSYLHVVLNNGQGSFTAPDEYIIDDDDVYGIAAIDIEGDHDLDIVVGRYDAALLTVFVNDGNGAFTLGDSFPAQTGGAQFATGDFDGDGDIDIATSNWDDPGHVSVLLNNGSGDFSNAADYPMDYYPAAVLPVDADLDGDLDLAVAIDHPKVGYVTLLVNDGGGDFSPDVNSPVDEWPESLAAADLNGDGPPEIITGNWVYPEFGTISVLSNLHPAPQDCDANAMPDECDLAAGLAEDCNTNGAIDSCDVQPILDFSTADIRPTELDTTDFLAGGDLDGDGDVDLVITDFVYGDSGDVTVYFNNGLGEFAPAAPHPVGERAYGTILVDLDNQKGLDLVAAGHSGDFPDTTHQLYVLFNDGAGAFVPAGPTEIGVNADLVAAGDFNSDGYQDLAVAGHRSDLGDHAVSIQINDGSGGETTAFYPGGTYPFGVGPYEMAAVDVDADNDVDLIVAGWNGTATVLFNHGDASFDVGPSFPAAGGSLAIATGDFDGDGDIDAATANWNNPGRLSVLLNDGSGAFTVTDYTTAVYPAGVWTADFDGDADLDLLVPVDDVPGYVTVFLNNGMGQFSPRLSLPVGEYPEASVAADFNGDDKPDIATADYGDSQSSFSILLNDRMPAASADVDGDGQLDECRDSDGDGVPDSHDLCPGVADGPDSDGDGLPDGCDECPNDPNKKEPGLCGCGAADDDSDGDAVPDCDDICPGANDNADSDADSVPDCLDRCPNGDDTIDADGDGVPDCAQGPDAKPDADGDGVSDADDNCPQTANADQADADGDGVGDACDAFAGPNPPGDLPPADAPGDTPMDEQPPADQMSPSEDMCGIGACGGGSGSALAMALLSLSGFRRQRRIAAPRRLAATR